MSHFSTGVALCQGVIASGLPLRVRIRGTSMVPALWAGDTVTLRQRSPAEIEPGDVVVFARNRHFIVHRVVRRCEAGAVLITRGDAQGSDDSPVTAAELLGVVTAVHRAGGSRPLPRRCTTLARGVAWMVQRSPAMRMALARLNSARNRWSASPTPLTRGFQWR